MKKVCMALIRFYQRYLSRLKPAPTCRFTPTCSSYALEAFEKRGFFAGFALTFWRILRCSPLSPCGYDPVPEKGFRTMPLRWSKYDRPCGDRPCGDRPCGDRPSDENQDPASEAYETPDCGSPNSAETDTPIAETDSPSTEEDTTTD